MHLGRKNLDEWAKPKFRELDRMGWLVPGMVPWSVVSKLGRQRQVDTKFQTSLGYMESSKPAWITL